MSFRNFGGEGGAVQDPPLEKRTEEYSASPRAKKGGKYGLRARPLRRAASFAGKIPSVYAECSETPLTERIEVFETDDSGRVIVDGRMAELILLRNHQYGGSWNLLMRDLKSAMTGARMDDEARSIRSDMGIIERLMAMEVAYSSMHGGAKPGYRIKE